jgi:hypothetical protein
VSNWQSKPEKEQGLWKANNGCAGLNNKKAFF